MKCNICPRECGADRDNGQLGVCGVSNKIYVARTSLHMWEEPCISGKSGSGTVFFVGCNLGCVYCQNYDISRGRREKLKNIDGEYGFYGKEYSVSGLADEFCRLQDIGANNINLVTPTHYSLQIIDAVKIARAQGLSIPIVYNCSGYEKVETLEKLEGIVDIYLTDFKYADNCSIAEMSNTKDYCLVAKNALKEMIRQQKDAEFDENGIMKKGVIVRNLLLPGQVNNSKEIIKYVYETYGDSVYLSVMNQYTPLRQVENMAELNRRVTKREYKKLVDFLIDIGVTNAFIQEGNVASESFIPDFE